MAEEAEDEALEHLADQAGEEFQLEDLVVAVSVVEALEEVDLAVLAVEVLAVVVLGEAGKYLKAEQSFNQCRISIQMIANNIGMIFIHRF